MSANLTTVTFDSTKWKLVPIQPTQEMLTAPLAPGSSITGARYESRRDLRPLIWQALLSATPTPPLSPDSTGTAEYRDEEHRWWWENHPKIAKLRDAETARLTPSAPIAAPAREALWDAIHESMVCAWNLVDGTHDDASGVDQADWDALSASMKAMGALVPETEQPFSPSYAVRYLRNSIAAPVWNAGPRRELAELIRSGLLGVSPDSQELELEDKDWRVILDALGYPAPAGDVPGEAQTQEGGR
jgi:hypothetical protein